ncbi:MAG: hypothetical protein GF372_06095 [Candidatus Marinimicrobia bacterium]|nr:hypothetical protein [Candidatus Neomarinimicrobiota bacterium]
MRTRIITPIAIVMLSALVGFTACEKNPVDEDEHEHAEAEAMLVVLGQDTLLFQHEENGILKEDTLRVTEGEETNNIVVSFQHHDGDFFQPMEEHFALSAASKNEDIATTGSTSNKWEFTVSGEAEGITALTVQLMHEGHPDFTGQDIPVKVTQ